MFKGGSVQASVFQLYTLKSFLTSNLGKRVSHMLIISHSSSPFIYGGKKKNDKNLTSWRNERCHKGCESFHGTLPSDGINDQIWSQINCIWRHKSLPQFLQEATELFIELDYYFIIFYIFISHYTRVIANFV